MLGHDHHLAAPAGALDPDLGVEGEVGHPEPVGDQLGGRVPGQGRVMVADQAAPRPGSSGKAPQGLADRRRRRPTRTLATRSSGSRRPGAGRGCRRRGRAAPGPVPARESSSSHSSAVAAKSSARPGVGQGAGPGDGDEPAAGARGGSRSSGQGSGTTGWLINGKSTTSPGTGRLGGPWTPRTPASRYWAKPPARRSTGWWRPNGATQRLIDLLHHQRRPRQVKSLAALAKEGRGQAGRRPVPGST